MYAPIPHNVEDERVLENTRVSQSILTTSVRIMVGAVCASCAMLGVYALNFYPRTVLANDFQAWELAVPKMYHSESPTSSVAILLHIIAGAFLLIGVPLQFIKGIRRNYLRFHRWNGRVLIACSCSVSLGVLTYVVLVGDVMGPTASVVAVVEALFMLLCAFESYRHAAWTKKIERHQLWSYRLFAIASSNLLVRLYSVGEYLVLPNPDVKTVSWIATFLSLASSLLFAEWCWRQNSKERTWSSNWVCITCLWAAILFLCLTTLMFSAIYWIPMMSKNLETLKEERLQQKTQG